jgi:hypothetical protein
MDRTRYHLKVIALALFDYHKEHGRFPPAVRRGKNGKPLFSWRVLVCPYLEQKNVFRLVKQEEPWDSKANRLVTGLILKVYSPVENRGDKFNHTYLQAFTGPGTAFSAAKGPRFGDLTRRKANPILIAEGGKLVPWTKPAEVTYAPKGPLLKLGGVFKPGFHVLLAEGSVRFVRKGIKEKTLRRMINGRPGAIADQKP